MVGLLKVVVVMAVIAAVGGFATHFVKDKASSAFHQAIDPGISDKLSAHPWAPLSHGKPVRTAKVRFTDGALTTTRCHGVLGGYTVHIDHGFAFTKAPTAPKAGCPGGQLQKALTHATKVALTTKGSVDTLTLTNAKGHTVATLQGRHR